MPEETISPTDDRWALFRFFLGRWTGTGSGKVGESQAERTCKLVLNDQFIRIEHRSEFLPQERNPDGESHEEICFLSYDQSRDTYVLREFHVEGYVNQYSLEEPPAGGMKLVFTTEEIENIPPGWRARTTYEILGENAFRETFDLAGPGKDWGCYITIEFTRVDA